MIKDILMVGLPASMNGFLNSASRMILYNLIGIYGDSAVAAIGIVRKLDELPMHIVHGLTQGVMPLIGYNYAAKNYDRMEKCRVFSVRLAVGTSLVIGSTFFILAPILIRLFISDDAVIVQGTNFLRIHVMCLPFLAMNFAIRNSFQAMGKGPKALIVSVCRQGLIYVPLMYLMNGLVGVNGVIAAQIAADGLSLVVAYALRAGMKKEWNKAE
jgi:Na+-driven multidrug efflux pump